MTFNPSDYYLDVTYIKKRPDRFYAVEALLFGAARILVGDPASVLASWHYPSVRAARQALDDFDVDSGHEPAGWARTDYGVPSDAVDTHGDKARYRRTNTDTGDVYFST